MYIYVDLDLVCFVLGSASCLELDAYMHTLVSYATNSSVSSLFLYLDTSPAALSFLTSCRMFLCYMMAQFLLSELFLFTRHHKCQVARADPLFHTWGLCGQYPFLCGFCADCTSDYNEHSVG